jgi:hypothetical protein
MTADVHASTAGTTGAWLLPHEERLSKGVAHAALAADRNSRGPQAIATLTRVARATLTGLMLEELRRCLDDDLVDVLVDGLDAHSAVRLAAEETAKSPGSSSRVRLARHRLRRDEHVDLHLTASPAMDVVVPFDLELDVTVAEASGTVVDGHLADLTLEPPYAVGRVKVHGHEVYQREGTLPITRWSRHPGQAAAGTG